ncbi:MAG: universal stress protein [Rhizobiales bacterium]|nr:universal stress protein [Hyphomicrobiales bacterium]
MEDPGKRFRILTCIDGSEESYRGLRYAARLGSGVDADVTLLYVRAFDSALGTGGLDPRLIRENLLDWDLDLPGIRALKAGRDILLEVGLMDEAWISRLYHSETQGDPLGDNAIEYISDTETMITLRLKVASDIVNGILEECEDGDYTLVILGASERWQPGQRKTFWDPAVAEKIVARAPASVIVARELEQNHGHLICTNGSEASISMARKDAILASRCACPISLLSVAPDEASSDKAQDALERTRNAIEELGVPVMEAFIRVGDLVTEIIEAGAVYSVIVVAHSPKAGLRRLFETDTAFQIVENARNSVMVIK